MKRRHRHRGALWSLLLVLLLLGSGPVAAMPGDEVVLEVPLLRQTDVRWRELTLGTDGATIGSEGCALTSFAMVASYWGVPTTPAQARTRLDTYAYPLEWVAAQPRYGFYVVRKDSVRFRDARLHAPAWVRDTIEDHIRAGCPVIVGLLQTTTGAPHFIVAYGVVPNGDGSVEILLRDPSENSDYQAWSHIPAGWTVTRLVVYRA